MTDWIARARKEVVGEPPSPTAKTAETPVSSVSAVGYLRDSEDSMQGFVGFGSSIGRGLARSTGADSAGEAWEERAAIMEHDGEIPRAQAEALASKAHPAGPTHGGTTSP